MEAARNGSVDVVKMLVERCGDDCVREVDGNGCTPLHHAVMGDQREVIQWFCSNYQWLVDVQNADGDAAMHLAARAGRCSVPTDGVW